MTPERYLEVQFIKHIRKGYVTNAELSPQGIDVLLPYMSPDEHCIVTMHDKQRRRLWFTNRRLLLQEQSQVTTLFEYQAVSHVHWMFKDFWDRLRASPLPDEEIARTKTDHFDRLEVELKTGSAAGLVTLEGLDQSYLPIFQFLQFLTRTRSSS
jgi:hypothetical protein